MIVIVSLNVQPFADREQLEQLVWREDGPLVNGPARTSALSRPWACRAVVLLHRGIYPQQWVCANPYQVFGSALRPDMVNSIYITYFIGAIMAGCLSFSVNFKSFIFARQYLRRSNKV